MMMLGERNHPLPAIHVPPWPTLRCSRAAMDALRCFVPGNDDAIDEEMEADAETTDLFSSDRFRIYEFKVRRCPRGRPHDWTECPYAHPGEKARRRDPRRFRYSSAACPDFRKGGCRRGDACELAHGVFECWLHPERYRTQPCKDGIACRRRVCFFAHTTDQLRVLSPRTLKGMILNSPTSTLASPPLSPTYGGGSPPVSPGGLVVRRGMLAVGSPVDEVMVKMAKMQIGVPWGVGMRRGFGEHGGEDAVWPEEEQPLPDVDWVKELVK